MLTIDAQTNGLASDGTVTICSGTIAVRAQEDGIAAGESLVVSGGALDIQTGQRHEQLADETVSTKCLKSDAALSITGGTFVLDSAEDGVHGVEVQLLGGSFSIAAADDAIHADEALTIGQASGEGPVIDISTCYEGLEGAQVYLNAGSVNLCATDDGINAAGDESGAAGYLIEISDGDYWIDAGGDGLDSNGNIAMTGGTMEIYGAPNQENSALDYENSFDYQGGTLLAAGITGMTQTPTGLCVVFGEDGSMGGMRSSAQQPPDGEMGGQQQPAGAAQTPLEQPDEQTDGQTMEESDDVPRGGPAAAQMENALLEEGTAFSIQDEAGNVLYEGAGVKQANSIIFACGQLAEGQTYSLVVNGQAVATAQAAQQQGTGGRMAEPGGLGQA